MKRLVLVFLSVLALTACSAHKVATEGGAHGIKNARTLTVVVRPNLRKEHYPLFSLDVPEGYEVACFGEEALKLPAQCEVAEHGQIDLLKIGPMGRRQLILITPSPKATDIPIERMKHMLRDQNDHLESERKNPSYELRELGVWKVGRHDGRGGIVLGHKPFGGDGPIYYASVALLRLSAFNLFSYSENLKDPFVVSHRKYDFRIHPDEWVGLEDFKAMLKSFKLLAPHDPGRDE